MNDFRLCAFADEADKALSGQISALIANNMKLIELRGVDGENVSVITPEKAKEVKSRLDAGGISVWSIGSPIGKVDISSPADEETSRFCRVLDTAVICGAKNIRLFSFFGTEGDRRHLDEVVRRLEIMLSRAKGSGVELCHENEKGIYGDIAPRCAELHEALPELRGIFDPANFIQCGQDTAEAWKLLGKYIKYAHIKDATPDGHVVPPGTGSGQLPYLLSEFSAAGIDVLTLEPHLKVFKGLSELEGGKRPDVGGGSLVFASGREAFDYAADSLRKLIVNQ
ncbi:MAG: sugar phosphate isomerase/epimerase [Clostridia bacterium]|nr:sugar phosphate isomerase/epimerase [Clostridia bacterium]